MIRIFEDHSLSIGHTPQVRLNRITGGDVDIVVAGVGAGSTITGVSRYLKPVRGRIIGVVLTDSGERYLSSVLFEGRFDATGLPPPEAAAPST